MKSPAQVRKLAEAEEATTRNKKKTTATNSLIAVQTAVQTAARETHLTAQTRMKTRLPTFL